MAKIKLVVTFEIETDEDLGTIQNSLYSTAQEYGYTIHESEIDQEIMTIHATVDVNKKVFVSPEPGNTMNDTI